MFHRGLETKERDFVITIWAKTIEEFYKAHIYSYADTQEKRENSVYNV